MIEKILNLLGGITSAEEINKINILIENCTVEAIEYTHNEDAFELEPAIIQMVIYNYNRLGTEGVDGEDYSGVNFTYSMDYPANVIRLLKSKRKFRIL